MERVSEDHEEGEAADSVGKERKARGYTRSNVAIGGRGWSRVKDVLGEEEARGERTNEWRSFFVR